MWPTVSLHVKLGAIAMPAGVMVVLTYLHRPPVLCCPLVSCLRRPPLRLGTLADLRVLSQRL